MSRKGRWAFGSVGGASLLLVCAWLLLRSAQAGGSGAERHGGTDQQSQQRDVAAQSNRLAGARLDEAITLFERLQADLCSGGSPVRAVGSADEAEARATELIAAAKSEVARATSARPWLARPSPGLCAALDAFLTRTGSEMSPPDCSAAVALAFATASAPSCCSGYLRRVLSEDEPRFRAIRLAALEALAADPVADRVLLMRFAQSSDTREARISLARLAQMDDAEGNLRDLLGRSDWRIPQELADDWASSLARSRVLENEELVRSMMTEDASTAECVVAALARAPDRLALGAAVAELLDAHRVGLPAAGGGRADVVVALAHSGRPGLERVRALLEDPRSTVEERLMALQMLRDDDMPRSEAATRALAMLEMATAPDDVLTVVEIAVREPQMRGDLLNALRQWAGDDEGRRAALLETLESATMWPIRDLARSLW